MARILVTGAAGFIGSTLVRALGAEGQHDITAVDSFEGYYSLEQKRGNVASFERLGVRLVENDLLAMDLDALVADVDFIFHQAGQPGVRGSWGRSFDAYLQNNVLSTQRLLEAVRSSDSVKRIVYASSSSVYGDAESYPTSEETLPRPKSPYGVTKLAAEHLVSLYAKNYGISTVSLRYFTVYGPGQRPDMAFHRFIRAACTSTPITIYGTGDQVRDFTYIDDIVDGNVRAAFTDGIEPGAVFNLAGGSNASVNEVVDTLERITGQKMGIRREGAVPGDVAKTGGTSDAARRFLGWRPRIDLSTGLEAEYRWLARELQKGSV